jgi:hypothetical protein
MYDLSGRVPKPTVFAVNQLGQGWEEITGSLAGAQGADCTAAGDFCWRGVVTVFQCAADRQLEMNYGAEADLKIILRAGIERAADVIGFGAQ